VGKPLERLEDYRLLRGEGRYVDDIHLEGMLHGAVLRSPMAHGRILRWMPPRPGRCRGCMR
jgi:aerobic carbon-monoxide dehydrogenase large subunit